MNSVRTLAVWHTLAIVWLLSLSGCTPSNGRVSTGNQATEHGHDHHDHDHQAGGPHGGHLVELGDEQYHVEWLHDDDIGKVEVIILDENAQQEVAVTADVVTIYVIIDGASQEYSLEPTNAENGLASHYEIVSPELVVALQMEEGVQSTLRIEIDGTPFKGSLEHHDHHDH